MHAVSAKQCGDPADGEEARPGGFDGEDSNRGLPHVCGADRLPALWNTAVRTAIRKKCIFCGREYTTPRPACFAFGTNLLLFTRQQSYTPCYYFAVGSVAAIGGCDLRLQVRKYFI